MSNQVVLSLTKGLALNKISGDIDFGEMLVGTQIQNVVVSPGDGVLFEVTGHRIEGVTVNYTTSVSLTNSDWININGGSLGTLEFIPNVKRTGLSDTYIKPRNVRNDRRYKLKNDNGIGKLYLWIGGELM